MGLTNDGKPLRSFHVTGSMKQSKNCLLCYVDTETEQLIAPCKFHMPRKRKSTGKKKEDKKRQLSLDLKVNR